MDEAAIEDSSLPSSIMRQRDDDPFTLRLRLPLEYHIEGKGLVDYVVGLFHQPFPSPSSSSSDATASIAASSSRQRSSDTKPTTLGTSYPSRGYNGKDIHIIREYSSSEEATHGSASEAEHDRSRVRQGRQRYDMHSIGGQFDDGQKLKGIAKPVARFPRREKKPDVLLHQNLSPIVDESETEHPAMTAAARRRDGREAKSPRKRRRSLAAEWVPAPHAFAHQIGEPQTAHSANRARVAFDICTATIIFLILAILAMLMARHSFQEALAGLSLCLLCILATKVHEFR